MKASKHAVERQQRGLPEPQKCSAHKKDGTPCGRWPIRGGKVCPKHGGAAPQVRQKAAQRLADAADSLMAQLLRIAHSAESEAVQLAAVRDALDRAGFGATQMVKLAAAAESPWTALLEDIMDDDVLVPAERRALPVAATDNDPDVDYYNATATLGDEPEPDDGEPDGWRNDSMDFIRGTVVARDEPRASRPNPPKHIRDGLDLGPERGGRRADFA